MASHARARCFAPESRAILLSISPSAPVPSRVMHAALYVVIGLCCQDRFRWDFKRWGVRRLPPLPGSSSNRASRVTHTSVCTRLPERNAPSSGHGSMGMQDLVLVAGPSLGRPAQGLLDTKAVRWLCWKRTRADDDAPLFAPRSHDHALPPSAIPSPRGRACRKPRAWGGVPDRSRLEGWRAGRLGANERMSLSKRVEHLPAAPNAGSCGRRASTLVGTWQEGLCRAPTPAGRT